MGDVLERWAAQLIITTQFGSKSMLQRRLHIGQARAEALMTRLEELGIVAADNGPGATRDVLVRADQLNTVIDAEWPRCPDCGAGYRIGDEGCHHGGGP